MTDTHLISQSAFNQNSTPQMTTARNHEYVNRLVTRRGTGLTTGDADVYADGAWARTNATLADGNNTYNATASDTYGRTASDSVTVNLPATPTFQYDGNGNLTNDGRRVLEYDFENQLTNVYVASGWRSEFRYDAFGRQRVRREYTWSSGAWLLTNETRLVYDGMLVVQERDANNLAQVSYTRGNDLSGSLQGAGGIGGLLARTDNSLLVAGAPAPHAYYHCDGNGNVTALVSTNGIMLARYSYDPYGNLLGMSGPLAEANRYRFSSKEWNGNAGLYYYGYRFYDGGLQRWLNRDPIEEEGGMNLFVYFLNDMINYVDVFGLSGTLTIIAVGDDCSSLQKSGHAFIVYRPDGGTTKSYGTWGNNPEGRGNGLHDDLELKKYKSVPDNCTRDKHIDDKAEARLMKTIEEYRKRGKDGWTVGDNCSSFAANAWESATGEVLVRNEDFPIVTPTKLRHRIQDFNKKGYVPPSPKPAPRNCAPVFETGIN